MSRQDVEKQLGETRKSESNFIAMSAACVAGLFLDATLELTMLLGNNTGNTTEGDALTIGIIGGAALIGGTIGGALQANSLSQTAAALEGRIAADQLSIPEPDPQTPDAQSDASASSS